MAGKGRGACYAWQFVEALTAQIIIVTTRNSAGDVAVNFRSSRYLISKLKLVGLEGIGLGRPASLLDLSQGLRPNLIEVGLCSGPMLAWG